MARMHGAAVNGIRSAASLVVAIRTGNTSLHHEGDELHFEF